MTDLFFWLLTTYAVGLAAMPVAYIALPNLTDRGFGLMRPIGMLVFGSAIWMLSLLKILPNVSWSWWLIVLIAAIAGWAWIGLKKRTDFIGFLRRRWLQLILTEAVFLVFFCIFAFVKALDPDISHTEKPMDLTMLNAVISAQHAPPTDLWLSGYPIAYYYFGYWMLGGIAQMSGVQASIAYNLALATVAAMSAAAIFSLVSNLVRRDGAKYDADACRWLDRRSAAALHLEPQRIMGVVVAGWHWVRRVLRMAWHKGRRLERHEHRLAARRLVVVVGIVKGD